MTQQQERQPTVEARARLELQALEALSDEFLTVTEHSMVTRHFAHWLTETAKLDEKYPAGHNDADEGRARRVLYQDLLLKCERVIGEKRVCVLFRCQKDLDGVYCSVQEGQ